MWRSSPAPSKQTREALFPNFGKPWRSSTQHARACTRDGYKPQIDGTPWLFTGVRHTVVSSGYVSTLTLETLHAEGVEGGDEAGAADEG